MTVGRYALMALGIAGGSLGLAWPLLSRWLDRAGRLAAVAGAALAVANTVAAYGLIRWSVGRSVNTFMGAVLGGMVGRMGVMLAAVVAAVLVLDLPEVPLAVSLLGYFVLFLVLELRVLHRTRQEPAQ
jgi:branched-subunit amino acid ABC-type transport system permease component